MVGNAGRVSIATASRVVARVSKAIANLRPRYIKMPEGDDATEVKQVFYNRFPRCMSNRPYPC